MPRYYGSLVDITQSEDCFILSYNKNGKRIELCSLIGSLEAATVLKEAYQSKKILAHPLKFMMDGSSKYSKSTLHSIHISSIEVVKWDLVIVNTVHGFSQQCRIPYKPCSDTDLVPTPDIDYILVALEKRYNEIRVIHG